MTVRPARREHHILKGFVYLLLFGAVGAMVFFGVYELHKQLGTSTASKIVHVPDLAGLTEQQAQDRLHTSNLVGVPEHGFSGQAQGHGLPAVADQAGRGAAQERGDLLDQRRPGQGHRPCRTGRLDPGRRQLDAQGQPAPGRCDQAAGRHHAEGWVISTNPASGQSVPQGTAVELVVGSGQTTVPAVIDTQLADATAALTKAGLTYQLTYRYRAKPANTVTFQNPKPGKAALNTPVQLTISLGPPPKPVVTTPPPTTPPTSAPPTGPTTPPTGPTTAPPAGTTTTAPPAAPTTTPPAAPTTTAAAPPTP